MFRLILFVLFVAALAGGWWYTRHGTDLVTPPPTVTLQKKDIVEAVYGTGEVEPRVWLQLSPQTTARFTEVLADDGDSVVKDQLLARADDAAEMAKLEEFRSHLEALRNDFERNRKLQKGGYITKKAFEAATADYREIQSRIDNQQRIIDRLSLKSPIDGIVLRRDIEPGEVKTPADTVFTIGKTDDIRVTAEVDEEDILKVKPGQKALLKTDAMEGTVIEGTVDEITPKGDPVNKNFRLRISLPQDSPLLIGMTLEVNVVTAVTKDASVLPLTALRDGKVYVQAGNRTEIRNVKTGRTDGQVVEILSGLADDERVLAEAPAAK